jgi:hypothetical protein
MGRTAVKVSVANTAVEPKIFELVTWNYYTFVQLREILPV